jgi:hypothetical protein
MGGVRRRQLPTGNGVWICHRSNYPNAEPAEASSACAACLVSILSGAGPCLERALLPRRSAAYA